MDTGSHDDHLVVNLPHHIQQELCTTRATYRQGKKLTAVKVDGSRKQKRLVGLGNISNCTQGLFSDAFMLYFSGYKMVYTVNNESQHLLIYRVPEINLRNELHALCEHYGKLTTLHKLELVDPGEEFTEIFHVCYSKMRDARKAKRFLDGRSFYGSLLHVCYAPELESIDETRLKLINRRNEIAYFTGRRLKVPNINSNFSIASKRGASFSRNLHENKLLRRATQRIESSNKDGANCSDPENMSSTLDSQEATPFPSFRLPEVVQPEDIATPGTSGRAFIIGPYDQPPSYPSQEILKLPGQEIKTARDQKLMPRSVLRRNPSTKVSTNKIIFHQRNTS